MDGEQNTGCEFWRWEEQEHDEECTFPENTPVTLKLRGATHAGP